MVNKAPKRKHVSPESLLLSILNDLLFLNSQKLDSCFRRKSNSDACSFIVSLNFAKVGNFTSRSNEIAPLINEAVAKGKNFDTGTRVGLDVGHLLKSALAGGISCAFSAFLMHPVDTVKVQSIASFIGTVLGTTLRIPCEVLKQRLQANQFDNIVEATVSTWHQEGLKGLFRGTGVTLLREVPFYVAGMGLYNQSKKVVERQLGRELEPWEAIAVGALSGGFTAVLTTPFDVIKTRMMTAPQGVELSMLMAAYSILTHEGPLAFYKGAVPRFFWTAPLGALNLAGYELLQKAMITPLNQSVHSE
uniref:Putative mitochondrial carrier protein n=1 Tax=Arabidopsis thaliana TaxID=3702 RepID=O48703_ARATH|nr:putative mitochondrial carrier protein [Arabidopsis thaliana]